MDPVKSVLTMVEVEGFPSMQSEGRRWVLVGREAVSKHFMEELMKSWFEG